MANRAKEAVSDRSDGQMDLLFQDRADTAVLNKPKQRQPKAGKEEESPASSADQSTTNKSQRAPADKASKSGGKGTRNGKRTPATAESMAKMQREISVSEFFAKNRHLLGFDNKRKALLTTVKEAVDNSLDACEEAGILPDITVVIRQTDQEVMTQRRSPSPLPRVLILTNSQAHLSG